MISHFQCAKNVGVKLSVSLLEEQVSYLKGTYGTTLKADIVIGACDGYHQIYHMLKGRYRTDIIDKAFDSFEYSPEDIFPGTVCLFLGVDADYTHLPAFSTYILSKEEQGQLWPPGDTTTTTASVVVTTSSSQRNFVGRSGTRNFKDTMTTGIWD